MWVPPKISFQGDRFKASLLQGEARELLRKLLGDMEFQGLKQGSKTLRYDDGTVISAEHRFGESVLNIYCPEISVPSEEKKKEEEERKEGDRFFVRYISGKKDDIPGVYSADQDPDPYKYSFVWVVFEEDDQGQTVVKTKSGMIPEEFRDVGQKKRSLDSKKPSLYYNNFSAKSFEEKTKKDDLGGDESDEESIRFVGYTGCVPMLFREEEKVYEGSPKLEDNSELVGFADFYYGNFHKFHILNRDDDGVYLAWYYYREQPYYYEGVFCLYDMRYAKAMVDVSKITGDKAEKVVNSPRLECRGSIGVNTPEESWHRYKVDSEGKSFAGSIDKDASCIGMGTHLRVPQGANAGFDLVECRESGENVRVTLYTNISQGLAKATYRQRKEDDDPPPSLDFPHAVRFDEEYVSEAYSLYWDSEGSVSYKTLTANYELEAYLKFGSFKEKNNYTVGSNYWQSGPFGFCGSSHTTCMEDNNKNVKSGVPYDNHMWTMPFYWDKNNTDASGRFEGVRRRLEFAVPFWKKFSRRIYREAKLANAHIHHVLCRHPYYNYQDCSEFNIYRDCCEKAEKNGSQLASGQFPRIYSYGYIFGTVPHVRDELDFNFDRDTHYNGKGAPACEVMFPNMILSKGTRTYSKNHAFANYYRKDKEKISSSYQWDCNYPKETTATKEQLYEEALLHHEEFSGPIERTEWIESTGEWSDGSFSYDARTSASSSDDEYEAFFTDGHNAFELPNDGTEYFFMDDRGTTESQGVFIAVNLANTWKFFHFWEDSNTLTEVTDTVLEGVGAKDDPQRMAAIQCIGLV